MNNPWFQLLIPAIVILLPAVIRVLKSLQEQAEKQERRRQAAMQRDEALRTGRGTAPQSAAPTPVTAPPTAPLTLEQRAARRRAELAAVRERAEAQRRAQGQQIPVPLQILLGLPGTAGPTVPPRRAPSRTPPTQRVSKPPQSPPRMGVPTRPIPTRGPRPGPRVQPVPTRPSQTPPAKRTATVKRSDFVLEDEAISRVEAAPRPVEAIAREARVARPGIVERAAGMEATSSRPVSAAEWRRAILLSEVLGKPVGLRPPVEV